MIIFNIIFAIAFLLLAIKRPGYTGMVYLDLFIGGFNFGAVLHYMFG